MSQIKPTLAPALAAALAFLVLACGGAHRSGGGVSDSGERARAAAALPQIVVAGDEDEDSDRRLHEPPDLDQTPNYPTEPFGQPASAAESRRVAATVARYYADAARGDGAAACRLLAQARAEAAVEESAPSVPEGRRCAHTLSQLFAQEHKLLGAERGSLRVTAVRVEFNRASAQLRFAHASAPHYIGLHRERGVWKLQMLLDIEHPVYVE